MAHSSGTLAEFLVSVDLGSSVAEHDNLLETARVEASVFTDLLADRVDLVPGTKGSGKSALYRIFVDFLPEYLLRQRKVVFGSSVLRQILFAVLKTADEDHPAAGLQWLRDEIADYWNSRERLAAVLDFLASLGRVASMPHWQRDAEAAMRLAGAGRNDHV